MRMRPSAISLTRLTYSSAISLKTSFAPHAPCILSTTGDCATEIIGKPVIAAPAAPTDAVVRNFRRDGLVTASAWLFLTSFSIDSLLLKGTANGATVINRPDPWPERLILRTACLRGGGCVFLRPHYR